MHPLVALTTGQAQVVSAIALIIVSGLAAWSAYGAFLEARRTREQAARPSLALDLVSVTNLYVEVAIVNVGQGAALDADLELAFVPEEGDPVRRRWIWPLVAPGQRYQFGPPEVGGQKRPDLGAWAAVYPKVSLAGTVRDQLGNEHRVELT